MQTKFDAIANDYKFLDTRVIMNTLIKMMQAKAFIFMPCSVSKCQFLMMNDEHGIDNNYVERIKLHKPIIHNDIIQKREEMTYLYNNANNTCESLDQIINCTIEYLKLIESDSGVFGELRYNENTTIKCGIYTWQNYGKWTIPCFLNKNCNLPTLFLSQTLNSIYNNNNNNTNTDYEMCLLKGNIYNTQHLRIDNINDSFLECIMNKKIESFCVNYNLATAYLKKYIIIIQSLLDVNSHLYNEILLETPKVNNNSHHSYNDNNKNFTTNSYVKETDNGKSTDYYSDTVLRILYQQIKSCLEVCHSILLSLSNKELISIKSLFKNVPQSDIFDKDFIYNFIILVLPFFGQLFYLFKSLIKKSDSVDDSKIICFFLIHLWYIRYTIIENINFDKCYTIIFNMRICKEIFDCFISILLSHLCYNKYFIAKSIGDITTFCVDSISLLQYAKNSICKINIDATLLQYINDTLRKLLDLNSTVYNQNQKIQSFNEQKSIYSIYNELFNISDALRFDKRYILNKTTITNTNNNNNNNSINESPSFFVELSPISQTYINNNNIMSEKLNLEKSYQKQPKITKDFIIELQLLLTDKNIVHSKDDTICLFSKIKELNHFHKIPKDEFANYLYQLIKH